MNFLEHIKKPIQNEFSEFEKLYAQSFTTENPLLVKVYAHVLASKGKQIRPLLALLSAKLCGAITESSFYSALTLELLHNTSLIHDDVVDGAMERRGVSSVNCSFGNKVAVLSGDHLLAQVFSYVERLGSKHILKAFSNLGKSLADGELLQLINADKPQFDEARYLEVITKKTAILFSTCMYAGAISSGKATEEQAEKLRMFGEYLGICFQIKDDIFDYLDDSDVIGKPTGNDIREKKITLPLIYAYRQASAADCSTANAILQKKELSSSDVDFFLTLVRKNKGVQYAMQRIDDFRQKAIAQLDGFSDQLVIESLVSTMNYVVERKK